jgi:hypothetical protein
MKRFLLACLLFTCATTYGQLTYYWVGGASGTWASAVSWNTQLDGAGSPRTTANTADRLIFDGTNIGGAIPATGVVTPLVTSSQTFGQLALQNNARLILLRNGAATGTATFIVNGDGLPSDDLSIDATSILNIANTVAGQSMVLQVGTTVLFATGKIFGTVNINGSSTSRLVAMNQRAVSFESSSNANVNLTAASSYPFGNSTQTVEKAVIFQSGANLNYLGGNSPMGNVAGFSSVEFLPGSNWYHKATNAVSGAGSFVNSKSFGNIIVQNGSTLAADGPVYRIYNLTIETGSTFITHTTGHTSILGNLVVDGTLTSQAVIRSNTIVMGGTAQSVSGSGTITIPSLMIGDNAVVALNTSIIGLDTAVNVYGTANFNTYQLTGNGKFNARVNTTTTSVTGTLVADSFQIRNVVGSMTGILGLTVTGAGIAPNTTVVGFSGGNAMMALSKPVLSGGTNVTLTFASDTATLATSNTNGFNDVGGSVNMADIKTYQSGTNYIINAATTTPFGITTGAGNEKIHAGYVEINAPVTVNRSLSVYSHLTLNNKLTLRLLDTVHITTGAVINGAFNSTNYIATTYNAGTGEQSVVRYDGIASTITIPVGTAGYYLPATINPASSSDFTVTVFEGITSNGAVNGPALTPVQKQSVVNAVWNINRLNGSGNSDLQFGWDTGLEGSTFTTLPGTDIGVIMNTGSSWSAPLGTGDNTGNTAGANTGSFGSFSIGAVPPSTPFVFNALPVKTYGDADFNGGAISLNTTQPIIYSSSNNAVATIVAGNIHITGAGTADITASQASDGFYPAASMMQTLTVNKAALTITADNKTRFEAQANPTLTVSYNGFVLTETAAVLLTVPVITTTAVLASPPGAYPITVTGATAANYTITFVNGALTVQPKQNQTITFAAPATKTYGNADFAIGATSTNTTIPVTVVSSNTSVATIIGNNIHIVGAGTSTITASQAGNAGYFPAADVARILTVNKAALTIRLRDTLKTEGDVNPPFTITYTGFVLGETSANLLTPPVATTTATTLSAAGYYPITLGSATSNNYNITYTNGRLTVLPPGGASVQHLNAFMSGNSTLTVRVYSVEPALGDITLYDFSGKPLLKKNLFMPAGFINTDIAIPTIPSGIYIITVKGNGVSLKKTIPIIKQ